MTDATRQPGPTRRTDGAIERGGAKGLSVAALVAVLFAILAPVSPAAWAQGAKAAPAGKVPARGLTVTYLSTGAVYVDGGRQEGLEPGSRLVVRRSGDKIAELEVLYVAEHSASCRVVSALSSIRQGDAAVLASVPAESVAEAPPAAVPEPARPVPEPLPAPVANPSPRRSVPRTRASGAISYGFQQYRNGGAVSSGGFDEGTGRLSLRLRDLGGRPLDFRARMRSRTVTRSGFGLSGNRSEQSDRLYELSLTYAPEGGRFAWQVGRLGVSPFVGIGYLDGALGQVRLTRRFHLGAFAGSRPEVAELGLASIGQKYGAFVRYATAADEGPGYAEVVIAGIGEYAKAGAVSREYVSLESRFGSGSRWSLFARGEVDVNRDWRREMAGSATQVSNASISGSVRFRERWRWSLTYDQRRNYLTYETKPRPEDVFNLLLREGARTSLEYQGSRGLNVSAGVGLERQESGQDPTTSATLTVYHSNLFGWMLLGGADVTYYTGGVAEGYVASLRVRKYLRGGHDLGLTIGASETKVLGAVAPRSNQWARLSGTLELPFRLYLLGEIEYSTGDDLEGTRYLAEIGRRF